MTGISTNRFCNLRNSIILLTVLGAFACASVHGQVPAFTGESAAPAPHGEQTAVLAGGCFWGVDAVFKHVKGVASVVSGYSGGKSSTAEYETVSTGTTGHAESVKITFDPSQISYAELLRIYFSVATDPTQLNRQGPDTGTQYRGVIFYANEDQKKIAEAYIDQLNQAKVFPRTIVTQVVPLKEFFPAEDYHQNYLALHPDQPYIVFNDQPKLRALKKDFPEIYKK
ncbi:MAG TPA: peptide-methionine (S)-S-oxide reductase MsrA [Terriglobia bacterium]|nr:peptide-methionine (S)-S-oxide reductase MsrA [Terriglobia bacterium]